jgi:hypothetical protein
MLFFFSSAFLHLIGENIIGVENGIEYTMLERKQRRDEEEEGI